MSESPSHHMELAATHSTGEEEWLCPICGRRLLMHWPPAYKKVILEPGDKFAIHSGDKGGLHLSPPQISTDEEPTRSNELQTALEKALEDVDFDGPSNAIN